MPEETVGAADLAACDCEPCKRKAGLPHNVHPGTIHGYSAEPPTGWRARRTTAELAAGIMAPTFGVELETMAPSVPRIMDLPDRLYVPALPFDPTPAQVAERDRLVRELAAWRQRNDAHRARQMRRWAASGAISAEEAVSVMAPRAFWLPCHDGSVSGPEYKSQPATLAYWRSIRSHLAGMYKALLHGGLRSHDGDACGMHVNIGTDAFHDERGLPDEGHLYRFATLVTANPRWSTRMAMRTHESVSHWSRFEPLAAEHSRREWARSIREYGYASGFERYCVLNGQNRGRIEFRLPRGTLRLDRFYAKIEWTAAMVEFTRDPHNVPQVSAFLRWAQESGEYPAMMALVRERFPARAAAVEA